MFRCAAIAFSCACLSLAAEAARHEAAPNYTVSSILNAASNQSGPFAPDTIVSLYGTGLSYETVSLSGVPGGYLPERLSGSGVHVMVNNMPAGLFYVSPTQINFLLSSQLLPGPARVQVVRDGVAGPAITIRLAENSPGLFQLDPDYVVATRPDGSVITPKAPTRGGELIILYATGLGATTPLPADREIPRDAARIDRAPEFRVEVGGVTLEPGSVEYAGLAPGFAGLFQINVRLPQVLGRNPDIAVGFEGSMSAPGVRLPAQ